MQLKNFSFPKFGTPRSIPLLAAYARSPMNAAWGRAPAPVSVVVTFLVASVTWTVVAVVVTLADRLITSPAAAGLARKLCPTLLISSAGKYTALPDSHLTATPAAVKSPLRFTISNTPGAMPRFGGAQDSVGTVKVAVTEVAD